MSLEWWQDPREVAEFLRGDYPDVMQALAEDGSILTIIAEAIEEGYFARPGFAAALARLTSDEAVRAACIADARRHTWISDEEAVATWRDGNAARLAAVAAVLAREETV